VVTVADDGRFPLLRSFAPSVSPARTFPQLADLLSGSTTVGERLPQQTRTMTFRVTARDNRGAGGGIAGDEMQVRVVGTAGPFRVTAPNTSATQSGRTTVTWSVARTDLAPVGAASVNIKLSTDGGMTFPITLAAATPNDGSQEVTLPSLSTATARIKVEAVANLFFDISHVNFGIEPGPPPAGALARLSDGATGDDQLAPASGENLARARMVVGEAGRDGLARRLERVEEELKEIRRLLQERHP
jgi:hypothetical protein